MSRQTKTFPTLYKKTSTGKIQVWTLVVDGNTYYSKSGKEGGVITTAAPTVCKGKNAGKANATTDSEQTLAEAQAHFDQKLKKDYTRTRDDAMKGEASELVEGGILPMLAHKFSDHGDKLVYPCFVQPKLDGHRCIGIPDGTLWSRTRKPITGVSHIDREVRKCQSDFSLDGELYNHAYRDKFEQLTHFIRQLKAEKGSDVVQYHVYDVVMPGKTFRERLQWLREEAEAHFDNSLVLVETREVANEDELMLAFEDFLAQGYEGAIARNANGLYENKRSYNLLKIKQFQDAEFECVAVEEGNGKMAGHAVFICVTEDGTEFKAKMKGSHDELTKFIKDPKLVVGKQVTVKYQGITNKNKVPRFPVALRIREDV